MRCWGSCVLVACLVACAPPLSLPPVGDATVTDAPSVPLCTPGAQIACACLGGSQGVQVCGAAGTLGPCTCPDAGGDDAPSLVDASADTPGEDRAAPIDVGADAGFDVVDAPTVRDAPAMDIVDVPTDLGTSDVGPPDRGPADTGPVDVGATGADVADPCSATTDCYACATAPSCGWCRATRRCMTGTATGPNPSFGACTDWLYTPSQCTPASTDPCRTSTSCSSCVGRGSCGWCRDTDTCHTGTSSGPTDRACRMGRWYWDPFLGICMN